MLNIISAGIIATMSETSTPLQRWLAIETSTDALSLALAQGAQVFAYEGEGAAKSSPHALPQIQRLMQQGQLQYTQLTAVVFGRGPGAFTALRTACSLAQGLALGADIPVLPVDTLMAVAEQARVQLAAVDAPSTTATGVMRVLAVLDARMDQVYSAAYEWRDGVWHEVQAARVHSPEQLSCPPQWASLKAGQAPKDTMFVCAGNAWQTYAHRWPTWVEQPVRAMPTAQALCRLAPALWRLHGGLDPALALPLYVRDKVAQTTAEREQLKALAGTAGAGA